MRSELQKLNERRFNESIALIDLSFEDNSKQGAPTSPLLQSSPLYKGPETSHDGMLNSWRCLVPNPNLQAKKKIFGMLDMHSNPKPVPGIKPSKFSIQKKIEDTSLVRNSRVVLRSFHEKNSHRGSNLPQYSSFLQETPTQNLNSTGRTPKKVPELQVGPGHEFLFKQKRSEKLNGEKTNLTTIDLIFVPPADDHEQSDRGDISSNPRVYLPVPSTTAGMPPAKLRRKQGSHSTDKTPRGLTKKVMPQPYLTERLGINSSARNRDASLNSPNKKQLLPELEIFPVGYAQSQNTQGRWQERVVEKHKLSSKMTSYKKLKQAVIISQSHINNPMMHEPQRYDWGGKSGVLSKLIQQAVTDLTHDQLMPSVPIKNEPAIHDLNNKTLRHGDNDQKPSAAKISTSEEHTNLADATSSPSLVPPSSQKANIAQNLESHSATSTILFPDSSLFKQMSADSPNLDRFLNISHGSVGYHVIQDVLEALVEKRKAASKPNISITKNQSSQKSTMRTPSERVYRPQIGEKSTEIPEFRVHASKRPIIRLPESLSSVLQMPTRPVRQTPGRMYTRGVKPLSNLQEIPGNKLKRDETPQRN